MKFSELIKNKQFKYVDSKCDDRVHNKSLFDCEMKPITKVNAYNICRQIKESINNTDKDLLISYNPNKGYYYVSTLEGYIHYNRTLIPYKAYFNPYHKITKSIKSLMKEIFNIDSEVE